MWFWTLIELLFKYGPAIFQIVKDIIALIKYLRADPVGTGLLAASDPNDELRAKIEKFKVTGDASELEAMRTQLLEHKNTCIAAKYHV